MENKVREELKFKSKLRDEKMYVIFKTDSAE